MRPLRTARHRILQRLWILLILLAATLAYCALRPVCIPLSGDDVAQFDTPIATRTDRNLYLQVFQQREGEWQQCKTWLARQLFF